MPNYKDINPKEKVGNRTLQKIIELRKDLDKRIPKKDLEENLMLATWNIREFDSPSFGARTSESFYYIAEIINRFDLVAIQEVRKDLTAMDRLIEILGPTWKYIINDVTKGSKGNKERIGFIFDTRKVAFGGLAGEIVLPPTRKKVGKNKYVEEPITQLARTPFMVGFQAGWTSFLLASVHIVFGKSKANDPARVKEIEHIANFLSDASEDPTIWSKNLILLGDFNIFDEKDKTMEALVSAGFTVPQELKGHSSNTKMDRQYDQIAFKVREDRFATSGNAGVYNFFNTVFREEDEKLYIKEMGKAYEQNTKGKKRDAKAKSLYYKTYWRTHQMSDHLPLWVQLKINYTDQYLTQKLASAAGGDFEEVASQASWSRDFNAAANQGPDLTASGGLAPDSAGADLEGKDLSSLKFEKFAFFEANFKDAVLEKANLKGADLRNANLHGANMQGADLSNANLSGANLFETDFSGANLEGANLTNCELFDTDFEGAKLEGAVFGEAQKDFLNDTGIDSSTVQFVE